MIVAIPRAVTAGVLAADPLLASYLDYRRSNSAPKTILRLCDDLIPWEQFMEARGGVLAATARKWNGIYTCRKFYQWLIDNEDIQRNPWARIEGPRRPQCKLRVLSTDNLSKLNSACRIRTARDLRDRALVLFLQDSGCRIMEAMTLQLTDIVLPDEGTGSAIVLGKGSKERTVYFTAQTVEGLRERSECRTEGPRGCGPELHNDAARRLRCRLGCMNSKSHRAGGH